MDAADERLRQVLLTSNPRSVLQYVIPLLLQLNIDSSRARRRDDDRNGDQHQHQQLNRTLLRQNVLDVLESCVHLTAGLQLIQQTAFALHLVTVRI